MKAGLGLWYIRPHAWLNYLLVAFVRGHAVAEVDELHAHLSIVLVVVDGVKLLRDFDGFLKALAVHSISCVSQQARACEGQCTRVRMMELRSYHCKISVRCNAVLVLLALAVARRGHALHHTVAVVQRRLRAPVRPLVFVLNERRRVCAQAKGPECEVQALCRVCAQARAVGMRGLGRGVRWTARER